MKQINRIQAEVINGNIAAMAVDAVIVPQFNSCASYGGVGGAMARSGARNGLDEYDAHAQKHPLVFGEAFMTASGGGCSKYLLHVATVGCDDDKAFAATGCAVYKALQLADNVGLKTIAVPAIGNGIIGCLTTEQSAKAVFAAVAQFAEQATSVEKVSMVIYGSPAEAQAAREVLDKEAYLNVADEVGQKKFDFAEWAVGFSKDLAGEDY